MANTSNYKINTTTTRIFSHHQSLKNRVDEEKPDGID